MAAPFYNEADQAIYEGGEHFIPQEQYRLGYTAPPSIANAQTTSGVTNTQAAYPYKWPPLQGAGDGPSGLHNVYGYDPNKTKTFSKQVWSKTGPTEGWTTQDVTGYWSPSGWKTAKGKNINHAGLEVPTLMGTLMDKWAGIKTGEKQVGDIKGTFTDSNWFGQKEEEDPIAVAALRRNLLNKIKAKAYKGPINVGGGGQDIDPPGDDPTDRFGGKGHPDAPTKTPEQGGWHPGVGGNGNQGNTGGGYTGGNKSPGHPSNRAEGGRIGFKDGLSAYQLFKLKELGYPGAGSNPGGYGGLGILRDILKLHKYKEGGRIGLYAGGDPEEPAEDIREIMRGENIPFSDQVEGEEGILEQLIAKYIEAGFPPDQAEEMAMQEFQQMAMGSEQDQGIASLV